MDETAQQGTAFDRPDERHHLAKVRVAGSNPVFRSTVMALRIPAGSRWWPVPQNFRRRRFRLEVVSQKARSTFVLVHPTEILQALVGLKDVEVLRYERRGSSVELMVEQVPGVVVCPTCAQRAQVKELPARIRRAELAPWPRQAWRGPSSGARPWIQAAQSPPESKDLGIHPARSPEATKFCTPV